MDSHIEDVVTCDFAHGSEPHLSQSELNPLSQWITQNVDHTEKVQNEDKDTGETKEEVNVPEVDSSCPQTHVDEDTAVPGEPSHSAKVGHAPPKPGSHISVSGWNMLS